MKKSIILIKLGGSSITDKSIPYKVRENVIRRLAGELKKAGDKYSFVISHGSGSFAHTSASKYGGKKGYKSLIGIAKVSADAARLNQIVIDIFVEEGLPVVSLSPMSMILAKGGDLSSHFFGALEEVLKQGLIPVVYGDVIWDKKWKSTIFSGEKILSEIAFYLIKKGYKIEKAIEVGETKGVYDLNGKTIEEIGAKNISNIERVFAKNDRTDVTGGIKHKVENAYHLASYGVETLIINGLMPKELVKAIIGKSVKGTLVNVR